MLPIAVPFCEPQMKSSDLIFHHALVTVGSRLFPWKKSRTFLSKFSCRFSTSAHYYFAVGHFTIHFVRDRPTIQKLALSLNFRLSMKLSLVVPSRLRLPLCLDVAIDATVSLRILLRPMLGRSPFYSVHVNVCASLSLQSVSPYWNTWKWITWRFSTQYKRKFSRTNCMRSSMNMPLNLYPGYTFTRFHVDGHSHTMLERVSSSCT